jgi:2-keto-4-pentenoate hydratase/2-oxohepta-3-ene-1,7-dioic acid hydratase in catechol pathway
MQLATLTDGIARIEDGEAAVLDLPYRDLGEVLAAGALERCRTAAVTERRPFDVACLRAPVPRPPKLVCIGINYACHLEELRSVLGKFDAPTEPVFFYVPSSAVCGPADDIVLPALAPTQVDHECELAVVIGRGGRDLDARTAWAHVAGVTLANAVSARDVQVKAMSGPMLELSHAKGFDGFKPMGPVLVTTDELSLPLDVEISCAVNGTEYQRARTTDLIFDVPACLAHVSRWVSLEPGDVVLTGSPAGVGFFQGRFMTAGDVVEVTGGGIGSLRNRLVPAASR